jgi:hypothetical protein
MVLICSLLILALAAALWAQTNRLTFTWANGSNSLSYTITVTDEGTFELDVDLTSLQADKEVSAAFTLAALQSIYIYSDQDVTLETNSGSAPGDTFTIKGGKPFVWYKDSGVPNPFTVAVTKFFLTNLYAGAATVKIRGLKDATP